MFTCLTSMPTLCSCWHRLPCVCLLLTLRRHSGFLLYLWMCTCGSWLILHGPGFCQSDLSCGTDTMHRPVQPSQGTEPPESLRISASTPCSHAVLSWTPLQPPSAGCSRTGPASCGLHRAEDEHFHFHSLLTYASGKDSQEAVAHSGVACTMTARLPSPKSHELLVGFDPII